MTSASNWGRSERRVALPANWGDIRQEVFIRDGFRCTAPDPNGRRCPLPATEVDHITPHYLGGGDEMDNLASLCTPHHRAKSSAEGNEAQAAQRAKKFRPKRPHPGSIPKGGADSAATNQAQQRQDEPVTTSFWTRPHRGNVGGQDSASP